MKSMRSVGIAKFLNLFTLLFFLLIGNGLKAQAQKESKGQTYAIIDNGSITDIQPYIDALNNSDMRNHRLQNKRYIIIFKTGVKVELFSATEIAKNGFPVNTSEYPDSFDSSRQEPIFTLAPNNFIVELYTAGSKHH